MQSARIWFQQTDPPITLASVSEYLIALGTQIEETSWSLGAFVVPQIYILEPVPFLLQINNDDYVYEEAKEFSKHEIMLDRFSIKLASCDARLEIGDVSENSAIIDQETFVFESWTGFDPELPQAGKLLKLLARRFHGVLEDNVNGTWWSS